MLRTPDKGHFVKSLERLLNAALLIGVLILLAIGTWVMVNQARIYGDIKTRVEAEATKAIGLPVEVGSVSGSVWKSLKVKDVKIRAHDGKDAPVFVYVPSVQARYSVPEVLRLGKKPIEIVVERPTFSLARDAAGKFNVRPKPLPSQEPAELPKLPALHVVVKDGAIDWLDEFQATSSQVVPFRRRIPLAKADVIVRKNQARYIADLTDATGRIHLEGDHDLDRGRGRASLRAEALELPEWVAYGAPSDDYLVAEGKADAVAALSYEADDPSKLKLGGQVWLRNVQLNHKDLLVPLDVQLANAAFDLKSVELRELAAYVEGNRIGGTGKVDIRDPKNPQIDLTFNVTDVDLATLMPIVPDLVPFGITGKASAVARVSGSSLDPYVAIDATLAEATAIKQRLGPGKAKIKFHHMLADVAEVDIAAHGGKITGTFWFDLDPNAPKAGGRAEFADVQLGPAAAPYLAKPLPLRGRARGHADIAGPMDAIMVSGDFTVADAGLGKQPIEAGSAHFQIHRGNITVSDLELAAPDGARLTGDVGWNDGGDLVLALDARNVDLRSLRRAGMDVDVSGRADATLEAAGNMNKPDTLEMSGRIVAMGGEAYGQPIADLAGDYRLADGRLTLSDIVGHAAGAKVTGGGVVAPLSFEREMPPPDVRLAFDAIGAELAQIPAIAKAADEPLGGLTGRASVREAQVKVTGGIFSIAGLLEGTRIDAQRVGKAGAIVGRFALVGKKLALDDLVLAEGPSRVSVSGDVRLSDDPELALRVRTADSDVRTLLSAINWRRLLQGTWMVKKGEESAAAKKAKPFAQLPGREDQPYLAPRNVDFDYWKDASKAPIISTTEQYEAAKPFWEALDGTIDAEVRIDGTVSSPYYFTEVDVTAAKAYGHPLSRASMLAWYGRGELSVDHFDIQAVEGGSVSARGGLGGNGRGLEVKAQDFELAWLNPWLADKEINLAGRAGARMVASGKLESPRLDISASAERGNISDFIYDRASSEAVFEGGKLEIKEAVLDKDGKEARMAGSIQVGLRPEVTDMRFTLDVRGPSLGIVSILTKGLIDWRGGDGTLHVDILGTQTQPRMNGILRLKNARVAVRDIVGEITAIDMDAQIGAGIVKLRKCTALYGGGALESAGFVTMKQFKFEKYLLDVYASNVNFKMTNGLFDGLIGGHISVGGKFERPSVTGELAVEKATLSLAKAGAQGDGRGGGGGGTPIDLSGLNVNIKDTTKVFQPNLMDVRVAGNLIVNGTLMEPDIKGVINVVPGGTVTTFYTNTFKVLDGSTVEFTGSGRPVEVSELESEILGEDRKTKAVGAGAPNARVRVLAETTVTDYEGLHNTTSGTTTTTTAPAGTADAAGNTAGATPAQSEAQRKAQTVKIRATITGTLDDLNFAFQSDPPSYTQAEIENLLGKPGAITGAFRALAGGQSGDSAIGGIGREVGYGAFNFLAKQWIKPFFDPVLSIFLRDYSLDLVGDPGRSNWNAFNIALSAESQPILGSPITVTYRRVINTDRATTHDYKRYGLNIVGIPLNYKPVVPGLDAVFPNFVIQDLGISTYLEDTAATVDELPRGLDLSFGGPDLTPTDLNKLSLFRINPTDAWRASILVGFRGRL
jgi:hypothetical protein